MPFFLLLDEIEDPHNLGSILRTAECTGVHGVIIPKRRSAVLDGDGKQNFGGRGGIRARCADDEHGANDRKLKEAGVWVAGADVGAERDVFASGMKFDMPLAIVIGNENKGIGRLIREKCDFLIKLPMHGQLNSLNASVAAGVLMYEVSAAASGRSSRRMRRRDDVLLVDGYNMIGAWPELAGCGTRTGGSARPAAREAGGLSGFYRDEGHRRVRRASGSGRRHTPSNRHRLTVVVHEGEGNGRCLHRTAGSELAMRSRQHLCGDVRLWWSST